MTPNQDTPKFAYLRNRPFLVIEIYINPASTKSHDRVRTEKKGWMKDEKNISHAENPMVVDRIKDKHLIGAAVIIDLLRDVVLKNRLDDSNEEVLAYYKQKYAGMIEQGKTSWSNKAAANMRDFDSFARSHMKTAGAIDHGSQTAHVARAVSRKV
jgi:hypothetical protein